MNREIIEKLRIDPASDAPAYRQLKESLKRIIAGGGLNFEEKLPSIRFLAQFLKMHPNTVAKVYTHLELEGFVFAKPGLGYFINLSVSELKNEREKRLEKVCAGFLRETAQLGFTPEQTLKHLTNKLKEGERDDSDKQY